jgi:hypothetical protein
MSRYALRIFPWPLFAGEALAHPGHGASTLHTHGWEYALLAAAIVATVGWMRAKK